MANTFVCTEAPSMESVLHPIAVQRLAIQNSRQWKDRRALQVRFLDGDPALHKYVADMVTGPRGWNACSGLQFHFDDQPNAEIRIVFGAGSSWSQLGTDALWVTQDTATMNLAVRLEDAGPHIDRPILHEFGHASGYIHGHQSPWVGPLDVEAVYQWYESRGYSRMWIESNVIQRYAEVDVSAIGPNVPSVMNYWIPGVLWQDGQERLTADYPTFWDGYAAETFYGAPPVRYTSVILPFVARS